MVNIDERLRHIEQKIENGLSHRTERIEKTVDKLQEFMTEQKAYRESRDAKEKRLHLIPKSLAEWASLITFTSLILFIILVATGNEHFITMIVDLVKSVVD